MNRRVLADHVVAAHQELGRLPREGLVLGLLTDDGEGEDPSTLADRGPSADVGMRTQLDTRGQLDLGTDKAAAPITASAAIFAPGSTTALGWILGTGRQLFLSKRETT